MQRGGHMGRAHYGASQSRTAETRKNRTLRDLICLVALVVLRLGTALSNVRTYIRTYPAPAEECDAISTSPRPKSAALFRRQLYV